MKIKRKNLRPKQYPNTRVCSDHYVSGSPSALFDENNPDWAPSLNLRYDSEKMESTGAKFGRYEGVVERSRKRAINEVELRLDPEIPEDNKETGNEANSVSTQTDLSMKDLQEDRHTVTVNTKNLSTWFINNPGSQRLLTQLLQMVDLHFLEACKVQ